MSQPARHLRAVDTNGELIEDVTPVPTDVALLTDEIVDLRRKVSALKGQITRLRKVDPRANDITAVLEHWQVACNHPTSEIPLDGKRAEYVAKMLDTFTVEDLKAACDGAGRFPYEEFGERFATPGGVKRKRRTDIPHILANEVRVEKLRGLADGESGEEWYREWLWSLCQRVHFLPVVLAHLGKYEPHPEVLAKAILYFREQQRLEMDWVDDELHGEETSC